MTVNGDRLAALLAECFAQVLPAGIAVTAADGMLWYSCSFVGGQAGSYVRENIGVFDGPDEEQIISVAVHALDDLQDYVSEAITDPWPGTTSQPPPHAEIRDSVLHLWYGEPDAVVLALAPVDIASLT
jgi:hypothetical protein